MAKQLKKLDTDQDIWEGLATLVDANNEYLTIVTDLKHPIYGNRVFTIRHSGEYIPETGEYWKHYVDFKMHTINNNGRGVIKRRAETPLNNNSSSRPSQERKDLESKMYTDYCRAAEIYGEIFPPSRYSPTGGRTPGRYRHLRKIYNQFISKRGRASMSQEFSSSMNYLRSIGLVSTPEKRFDETLKGEIKAIDRSSRDLGDAVTGDSPDLKYINSKRKMNVDRKRQKGFSFPGMVSTMDSMLQVDSDGDIVSKTSKLSHQTNFISIKHKKASIEDFKLQAKSFNPMMDKHASSVLRPLRTWQEGLTSTTKVFRLIWAETRDLIRVFGI